MCILNIVGICFFIKGPINYNVNYGLYGIVNVKFQRSKELYSFLKLYAAAMLCKYILLCQFNILKGV